MLAKRSFFTLVRFATSIRWLRLLEHHPAASRHPSFKRRGVCAPLNASLQFITCSHGRGYTALPGLVQLLVAQVLKPALTQLGKRLTRAGRHRTLERWFG